jgi:hypothetical protein
VDDQGTYVAHPNKEMIFKESIAKTDAIGPQCMFPPLFASLVSLYA